jgi:hypothetical protein
MQQQTHEVLTNGLGSFAQVSPDYELAPVGLASMRQQAQRLAEHGRNGDIYVVHAAEGETVIPVEVLDANPMVKELLFEQMRDMGLDPGRYMVGNDLNSLNPETGMPEFFFKSIFKGIGKVIKKVVKVVKKFAPIVLPIAAAAFGIPFLGPAFGAGTFGASFVGSGIGSLLGGDSIGTAFKKAAIGGGLASLGGFAKGAFSSTGTALGGLEGSFTGSTPVFGAPGTASAGQQIGVNVAASPGGAKSIFGATDASRAGGEASKAQFGEFRKGNIFKGAFGGTFGETGQGTPGFVQDPSYVVPNESAYQYGTGNVMSDPSRVETITAPIQKAPSVSDLATSPDYSTAFDSLKNVKLAPKPGETLFGSEGLNKFWNNLRGGPDFTGKNVLESAGITDKAFGGFTPGQQTALKAQAAKIAAGASPTALRAAVAPFAAGAGILGLTSALGGFETGGDDDNGQRDRDFRKRFDDMKYGRNNVYKSNQKDYDVILYPSDNYNNNGLDKYGRRIRKFANGGATFDPFSYTPQSLGPSYTPPLSYRDSRSIFNPSFGPTPAPVPPALDFQSSYEPLDVKPWLPPEYTPTEYFPENTAYDPDDHSVSLFDEGDYEPEKIPGDDEDDDDGLVGDDSIPVKPLFFFDDGDDGDGGGDDGGDDGGGSGGGDDGGGDDGDDADGSEGSSSGGGDDGGGDDGGGDDGGGDDGGGSGGGGGDDGGDDSDGDYADGGYIGQESRPRAQMLVEGPGTERSDDIPAMLSDGEFVLNARSVRGADPTGQGNRYLGAQNLYRMMRDFEMRA